MKKILGIIFLTLGLSLLVSVNAQQTTDLTLSPPTQELSLQPGESRRIQIKFFNRSTDPISGYIKKADFIVSDKDGTPTLIDTSTANNKYAAASWLSISQEKVTLAANSPYAADVYVTIPGQAYSCGHYAAVYFQPDPAGIGNKTGSMISFKLASLIYINIGGQCKEKAYVSKFQAPLFLEYGPIPVQLEILNRSDYHISPQGYVDLTNMLNQQTGLKTLVKNNIFPDAIRSYGVDLGSKWMFGRYKINLSAGFGKTGQNLTAYAYTWVFPWRVVLVILLTIIIVLIVIRSLYQKLVTKESVLEKEIAKEKTEIEKLKEELRKRKD